MLLNKQEESLLLHNSTDLTCLGNIGDWCRPENANIVEYRASYFYNNNKVQTPKTPKKMEIKKEKAVSFTGYRTEKILRTCKDSNPMNYVLNATLKAVEQLYDEGFTTFLTGMAKGFDLIAAEAVLIAKEQYPDICLVAVIPYEGQELGYNETDKCQYNRIYKNADGVIFIAKRYHEKAYFERNDYLLANCTKMICYYTGLIGGTMYTVNRAKKAKIPLINIAEQI